MKCFNSFSSSEIFVLDFFFIVFPLSLYTNLMHSRVGVAYMSVKWKWKKHIALNYNISPLGVITQELWNTYDTV